MTRESICRKSDDFSSTQPRRCLRHIATYRKQSQPGNRGLSHRTATYMVVRASLPVAVRLSNQQITISVSETAPVWRTPPDPGFCRVAALHACFLRKSYFTLTISAASLRARGTSRAGISQELLAQDNIHREGWATPLYRKAVYVRGSPGHVSSVGPRHPRRGAQTARRERDGRAGGLIYITDIACTSTSPASSAMHSNEAERSLVLRSVGLHCSI